MSARAVSIRPRALGARHVALVAIAAAGLLLAAASIAFACTARASLTQISPARGHGGDVVTVTGDNFHKGPVELHWDRAAGQSTRLAVATGPDFNQRVTIPADASSGPHFVVGVAYGGDGEPVGRDSIGFEVVSDDEPAESRDTTTDGSGDNSTPTTSDDSTSSQPSSSSMSSSGSQDSEPSSDGTMSSDGSPSSSSPPQESTAPRSEPSQEPSSQPSSSSEPSQEPSSQPSSSSEPATTSSPSQGPAADRAPQPTAEGSRAGEQDGAARRQPRTRAGEAPAPSTSSSQPTQSGRTGGDAAGSDAEPTVAEAEEDGSGRATDGRGTRPETDAGHRGSYPSARSGSADLWSGLDAGDQRLSPGLDEPAMGNDAGAAQPLTVLAAGLFAAGLLTLMTGGAVAARRRRVRARSTAGGRADG